MPQIKSGRAKDEIVASLLDQIKAKDEQLEIIIVQLRSKDNQIASLEEKLVGMSLEIATSKAMEDFHDHRLKQLEYEKKKTTPRCQYQRVSSLLSQESVERGGSLAQSCRLSRRQPREPAQQRFSRSGYPWHNIPLQIATCRLPLSYFSSPIAANFLIPTSE